MESKGGGTGREEKYGVPVGAICIAKPHIDDLRDTLEKHLREKIGFRGVDNLVEDEKQAGEGKVDRAGGQVLVHLPPFAAASATDPPIATFLQSVNASFLPGVRKQHISKLNRKKQARKDVPVKAKSVMDGSYTFAELFAGIGGFRLGLEAAGCQCVFASEISSSACALYAHNFGTEELSGDIIGIYSHEIPDFDILTGGFPCQTFSNRGEQKGFADERGQLYLELARLLHSKQPKAFIFENVVGLVLMEGGSRSSRIRGQKGEFTSGGVLRHIVKTFEECGYVVSWRVINARAWVPQQRERVYIVGTRRDLQCGGMDWDSIANASSHQHGGVVRDILEASSSACVGHAALSKEQWEKVKTASSHSAGGEEDEEEGGGGGDGAGREEGGGEDEAGELGRRRGGEREIDLDGQMQTLTTSYHRVGNITSKLLFTEADGSRRSVPRFLTPRECCRVMGFPEEFVIPSAGKDGHAAVAHCYRALGNAVVPPVIKVIGEQLVAMLRAREEGGRQNVGE